MFDDYRYQSNTAQAPVFDIPNKFIPFATQAAPYKIAHGGRGGAKSWTIAQILVLIAYSQPGHLILCTREFQASIADSVHAILTSQISRMGLAPWFTITDHDIVCNITKSRFIFKGIRRNISEIKSTEGITITWVEEAQTVSEVSWLTLIPTVRRMEKAKGDPHDSEIWISFNPGDDEDPTWKRFVLDPPANSIVVRVTWRDNPWFPAGLEEERVAMLRKDPDAYDWVWEGNTRHVSEATIFKGRFIIDDFEAPELMRRFMFGADWGFSNDPSVLTRCWVDDGGPGKKRLMVDYEAFGYHVESDDLQFLFAGGTANKTGIEYPGIPGSRENPIKADGARPETISFMRRQGFNIAAARKWKGSVEDGITYLKTYDQIVIHPRCVNFAQEARLYSYEIEAQTSKILRSVRDMHNHGWDSIRYGHDGLIVAKGSLGAWQRIADKGRAL